MIIPFGVLDTAHFSWPEDLSNRLPHLTKSSVIGISVAIAGNVIISLALNCQKLAHRRLEREREERSLESELQPQGNGDRSEDVSAGSSNSNGDTLFVPSASAVAVVETEPLLNGQGHSTYGTDAEALSGRKPPWYRKLWTSDGRRRRLLHDADASHLASTHVLMPVDVVRPVRPKAGEQPSKDTQKNSDNGRESDYLKSKLWYATLSLKLFEGRKLTLCY